MLRQQQHVTVCINLSADTVAALRRQIHGCEACSEQASLPFAELLMRLTGRRESSGDVVISEDIHCPACISPLDTDTLVEIQYGKGQAAAMRLSA